MVTGGTGNTTIGPAAHVKRRRRKEQHDEDDSSDLSDESDDEVDGAQRAAQQIKFAKMPARTRADSSPIRSTEQKEGPEISVISPSRRSVDSRFRRGSMGAVEAVKARARADTTTSSEMSSDQEVDPSYFQRRQISKEPSKAPTSTFTPRTASDELAEGALLKRTRTEKTEDDDSDGGSVGSAMSSELGDTLESGSLLGGLGIPGLPSSSPMIGGAMTSSSPSSAAPNLSPRKLRTIPILEELPRARPISVIQPVSLLGAALRARKATPLNPVEKFATLSGKGSPNPLWIKIYAPFSNDKDEPFEMPLARNNKDGANVIVAEAIGLALWRYIEEGRKPAIDPSKLNVNKWVMRMVEDGEVEYDFPALARTKAIIDFTSNNNRGARARSRSKPFDEFALVEASDRDFQENSKSTPQFAPVPVPETPAEEVPPIPVDMTTSAFMINKPALPKPHPVLGGAPFASALNNTTVTPADQPQAPTSYATPRMGAMKSIRVRYLNLEMNAQVTKLEMSGDTYIAEILDHVCKRWGLEKGNFILKLSGTQTLAPLDRLIETLPKTDLDLVRRRFGQGPAGFSGIGSPGSASPNAPLLLDIEGPKKLKKGSITHPYSNKQDLIMSAADFKKYNVTRKQLTSFSQANQRVLAFDGDCMHIMPSDTGKNVFDTSSKTTSIPFTEVLRCKVSSKHKKLVRIYVKRGAETKKYELEARNADEAHEIVRDVTKGMKPVD